VPAVAFLFLAFCMLTCPASAHTYTPHPVSAWHLDSSIYTARHRYVRQAG